MISARGEDMVNLRIEEGKKQDIGQSGDPLDGTWTRPDPALGKQIFMQGNVGMMIVAVYGLLLMLLIVLGIGGFVLISMLAIMLIIGAITIPIAHWTAHLVVKNHRFRITDEELIVENGLITTNRVLIPLVGIQQVHVVETFWSKMFGLKNVIANTAGHTYIPNAGAMAYNSVLMGLRNADEVSEAILARVKIAKSKS